MTDLSDLPHSLTSEPSFSELIGTWRGPLTWLIEEDTLPPRREEEIICVIRESQLEDGRPMAFIFAVDDERLASAETLVVSRTMHEGGWVADGILQHPGVWQLRVSEGRLIGTYIENQKNRPVKRFEAKKMVAW
jgi:hypothetical protein